MKKYLYNPENGSKIKGFYDGSNHWSLEVGECKAFPEAIGERLKRTYGFLREVSFEEAELMLAKLEKEEPTKIKVDSDGKFVPKTEEDLAEDKKVLESKKEEVKKVKKLAKEAEEAKPDSLDYWEMSRGALLVEANKRGVEVRGIGKKKVYVSKEQIINLLENDDAK